MRLRVLVVAAGYTILAACADTARTPGEPLVGPSSARLSLQSGSGDFVIDPGGTTVNLSAYARIDFPAGAVCDPDAAGYKYGDKYWDKSCKVLGAPIAVHVTVSSDGNGGYDLDFSPQLRFSPDVVVT